MSGHLEGVTGHVGRFGTEGADGYVGVVFKRISERWGIVENPSIWW